MIHSALLLTLGFPITAFMFFWSMVYSLFPDADNKIHAIANLWARILLFICNIKVEIIGAENFMLGKSQMFMANHQSDFDALIALAHIPVPIRWIAKRDLFNLPLVGMTMRKAGHIEMDQNHRDKATQNIDLAMRHIQTRKSMMTFPEGAKSKDSDIQSFQPEAFYLAIQSGIPIVPVSIIGSSQIMPRGSFKIKPARIKLIIAKPIDVRYFDIAQSNELIDKARNTIIENYNFWQEPKKSDTKYVKSKAVLTP